MELRQLAGLGMGSGVKLCLTRSSQACKLKVHQVQLCYTLHPELA